MDENKVTRIVGILAVFVVIYMVIRFLNKNTQASLYSNEALEELKDPEKLEGLNKAIDDYHNNGVWDEEILKSI